ncbi:MAG: ATP-binding protein [Candidatus Nanohaloarchaea archaeon]|nr:ATP-binding protein [Candidatus Nanohaloarchaea archaeon]
MAESTIYEGRLDRLIGLALREDGMNALLDGDRDPAAVPVDKSAIGYVNSMLTEEVPNQFGDEKRPLGELVSNAIDAVRTVDPEEAYVDIAQGRNRFTVEDSGPGMGREDIFEHLAIPFWSSKDGFSDIGRFGVGAFSSFEYCLEDPGQTSVVFETGDESDAYEVEVWSTSPDVDGLHISVTAGERSHPGTRVTVDNLPIAEAGDIPSYIDRYFHFVDPAHARIRFRKQGLIPRPPRQVNEEPSGATYRTTARLPVDGSMVEQPVRVVVDHGGQDRRGLALYSAGVHVTSRKVVGGSIDISLPPAVDLVEGRNGFVTDDTYDAAVDEAYQLLVDHADSLASGEELEWFRSLPPRLQEGLDREIPDEQRERLAEAVFPDGGYVVMSENLYGAEHGIDELVSAYLGPAHSDEVQSVPRNSLEFWETEMPGLYDLLADRTESLAAGTVEEVQAYADRENIPLHGLPDTMPDHEYRLDRVDGPAGNMPFLRTGNVVRIRADHPYFGAPDTYERSDAGTAGYAIARTAEQAGLDLASETGEVVHL